LRGIKRRQFMITPGLQAKLIRALTRKCTSLQRWIVDRRLARSIGGSAASKRLQ
jgi:hypothetical protein